MTVDGAAAGSGGGGNTMLFPCENWERGEHDIVAFSCETGLLSVSGVMGQLVNIYSLRNR